MVNPMDLVEYIVEYGLARNFDTVVARLHRSVRHCIYLLNGEVINRLTSRESGVGARLIYKGLNTHISTNIFSYEHVKAKVDKASSLVRMGYKDKFRMVEYHESESLDVTHVLREDKPLPDYEDDLIDYLNNIYKEIMDRGKIEVVGNLFKIVYHIDERYITTSEGIKIYSKIPRILIWHELTGKYNGSHISKTSLYGGSGGVETLDLDAVRDESLNIVDTMYNIMSKAINVEEGEYNLVLGNEVTGAIVHEAIGHPFEADGVIGIESGQTGESYMSRGDLNKVIGTDEVNVYDDPTIPATYGYYTYDDEGIPSRRRTLIKSGVATEYLHNRFTASIMGVSSNGAARSENYYNEPIVRMGVTYLEAGDRGLDELIEEARYGIYVKNLAKWNIDDKRVNQRYIGFEAYLIDGGEVKEPIKYPVIETSTRIILNSIKARADDIKLYPGICMKGDPIQKVPVSMGGPHILVTKIRVLRR